MFGLFPFQFNPLEYQMSLTIAELVEQVMRNHALAVSQGKGTQHKGEDIKETVERSSGE